MNRSFLHRKHNLIILLVVPCLFIFSFKEKKTGTGKLRIEFVNTANGKNIVLRDSLYKNSFGEEYSLSKLKYYISNFSVLGSSAVPEIDPYHLVNASEEYNGFEITLSPGTYNDIEFLLGVDSARNCSGAQTGALDPTNDMFWTWNSGYVMFKLEGTSPASTSDLQRIEHHIGGYKGDNNVVTKVHLTVLSSQPLKIREGGEATIFIEANLDNYWNGISQIKISETPVCTIAGKLAKKMAANFPALFSVRNIMYDVK